MIETATTETAMTGSAKTKVTMSHALPGSGHDGQPRPPRCRRP
jgi:hypothetical protein